MRTAASDFELMVDPERLELPTSAFEAHCSIQLSYGSAPCKVYLPLLSVGRHPCRFVTKDYTLRTLLSGVFPLPRPQVFVTIVLSSLGPSPGVIPGIKHSRQQEVDACTSPRQDVTPATAPSCL
jgi:hypothetical protein